MEEVLYQFADYDFFNWLFSIFSFLAGGYLGYRFNVWQDKRREFNEKRDPLIRLLRCEIEGPDPMVEAISEDEFEVLWWLMYPWQRKGFAASFKAYQAARNGAQRPSQYLGLVDYCEPIHVQTAARSLLRYLNRR